MSKIARFTLLTITFLILSALFWSFTPGVKAATVTASQTNLANPAKKSASFIGHAQAGCSSTITVANNGDSGAGSLRKALADVCNGGTINFAAGLANQTITLTSAELSVTKTVTITNPNAANLKVSGNNARRVFNIQATAAVTISSLSIISGTPEFGSGGGVLNYGILTVNNSTLSGNSAFNGGGILNIGTLSVNNSILSGNSAQERGGGIYNDSSSTMTVHNSVFNGNSALLGGSMLNKGMLTVNNSTLNSNLTPNGSGGGIYNDTSATLILNNSTLNGNSAITAGGIFNRGVLTIDNGILSGNSARGGSGGIYNTASATLTLNNSTINGNSAPLSSGGGMINVGTLTVNNSSLSGNSARDDGGGIFNLFGAMLTLNNSTLSSNWAGIGGGIRNEGTLHLRNVIIANSLSGGDCNLPNFGIISTNINSLIEDGSCSPALSGDPNLGPLQNNGGSTLTHALLPGSKAIDAGDNTTCLTTDQRGISRPINGNDDSIAICDIGAFEAPSLSTSTVQFTQAVYTNNEAVGMSVAVTLSRTGNLNVTSQVQVSLSGETASAGVDYNNLGFPLTLTFDSGVVSQTVPISLIDDALVEPTETISLTVAGLSNAVIGGQNSAVLRIEDNDTATPPWATIYLPLIIK